MSHKTALVTGANSGIGRITALELAKRGYHLIMVCRNRIKADEAKKVIVKESGNSNVDIIICDLGNMKQIREKTSEIRNQYQHLDLLVNNAGMLPDGVRKETEEGIEVTFAVNHLSYFLLTKELMPLLESRPGSRIINVASEAHRSGVFDPDNLTLKKGYYTFKAYGNSKLFNIMFTRQLASEIEGEEISTFSLHPGVVDTNFAANSNSLYAWFFNLGRFFMISPKKGAETVLYLCLEPGIESLSGQYFVKKKPAKPKVNAATNEVACKKLWELSEEILHSILKN